MATGYTYPVKDGEITKLGDFIKSFARAFIHHCDELPKEFEVSDWVAKRLEKSEAELAKINSQTDEEIDRDAEESYQSSLKSHAESVEKNRIEQERYAAMIAKAKSWDAPEILKPFKKKLIEHLVESKEHDKFEWEPPKKLSVEEWRSVFAESATRQIADAKKEIKEERVRAAKNAEWLKAVWHAIKTER